MVISRQKADIKIDLKEQSARKQNGVVQLMRSTNGWNLVNTVFNIWIPQHRGMPCQHNKTVASTDLDVW